ncbi:hypothetical protein L211DRAFT_180029 [Terfezia boudieri ATCC MYA-4762]|uniref:Uncharacterized protein n=1 Tax=Terfezia boudieri ATCC MYA-4762 TaxID=1051890 RepID=A0A3N4LSI7_9PEZI|nr:hypothetical protein L211DRAFT_180029 [Terfezia boudieri ATCC MYA-4762]
MHSYSMYLQHEKLIHGYRVLYMAYARVKCEFYKILIIDYNQNIYPSIILMLLLMFLFSPPPRSCDDPLPPHTLPPYPRFYIQKKKRYYMRKQTHKFLQKPRVTMQNCGRAIPPEGSGHSLIIEAAKTKLQEVSSKSHNNSQDSIDFFFLSTYLEGGARVRERERERKREKKGKRVSI